MEEMINAHHLCKKFKGKTAVQDISFSIGKGEIFGFLGHNGAGKTTTIRMLTGQIYPTSGYSEIAGFNSITEQDLLKPLIGVVADVQNLYERMSGIENLKLFADLFEVNTARIHELLELVHLETYSKEKVATYSNGMRQKLLIARALLHNPDVIFLDEPTRGLDPTSAKNIRDVIKRLSKTGSTIFLTSHNMEEVDDLCHRVAFIKRGELIALDTPQNLKLQHGSKSIVITFVDGTKEIIATRNSEDFQSTFFKSGGKEIQTIHSQEASLEDVFIKLAGTEAAQ